MKNSPCFRARPRVGRSSSIWAIGAISALALSTSGACDTATGNLLPAANVDTTQPFTHTLRITRHTSQAFRMATMDAILAEAGDLLAAVDFECPDVACPVTFLRDGSISTFSTADNIVTTEAQLDAIFDVPGDFKIVTLMVGVCGAPSTPSASVVLGCAFTGGSVVIAHDAPPDVWAHEWGHVQGLPHRNDCPANLMHAYELQTNAVNDVERRALLSPTPDRSFFRAAPVAEETVDPGDLLQRPNETLKDWVSRITSRPYRAGIPASLFTPEGDPQLTDALIQTLVESADPQVRSTACRSLGLAGDATALPVLRATVAGYAGPITTAELATLTEALMALGRLALLDPDDTTVAFLVAATAPDAWKPQNISLADGADGVSLNSALARVAVLSLGLSPHPAARTRLLEMQTELRTAKPLDPWMPDQIEEALARSAARYETDHACETGTAYESHAECGTSVPAVQTDGDSARFRTAARANRLP